MKFELDQVPFSRRGSYLSFNRLTPARATELGKAPGVFLRTSRGNVAMHEREIFQLQPVSADGRKEVSLREEATPAQLALTGKAGSVEIVFATPRTVRLRGRGVALRLTAPTGAYDYARPAGENRWEMNFYSRRLQLDLRRLGGEVEVRAPWDEHRALTIEVLVRPNGGGDWEIELEEFCTAAPNARRPAPFDALVRTVEDEFRQWLALTPPTPAVPAEARELAAYVQWSALIAAEGHFHREAMLMSKNWMLNVWSWDHCFNAIALAHHQPDLAWSQWAVIFDHQHASGALPDCVNDRDIVWNFTKPPVHGWALREMLAVSPQLLDDSVRLRQAVQWLERWTAWWLTHRDDDGDGLPQYNHGNDSGWDNATVFGAGMPVESPDLATFLIVQMEVIAELQQRRRHPAAAARWRQQADRLAKTLLAHSWRDGRFVSLRSEEHTGAEGDSLVEFMPLLLGDRLPPEVRAALVAGLTKRGRFLTAHGPATESPQSELYRADGYWRGPIWAPSTHLIIAGLRACGETATADEIARRFCRTVARAGCAENFDALTGTGLRDRAYTWTASVFLHLAANRSSA